MAPAKASTQPHTIASPPVAATISNATVAWSIFGNVRQPAKIPAIRPAEIRQRTMRAPVFWGPRRSQAESTRDIASAGPATSAPARASGKEGMKPNQLLCRRRIRPPIIPAKSQLSGRSCGLERPYLVLIRGTFQPLAAYALGYQAKGRGKLKTLLLTLAGALFSISLYAQTSQIQGTVLDSTGSAVPGADIKATQTATGAVRNATSGADGAYVLSSLPIGPYRVEVSKQGFTTYVQTGITLLVNGSPTVDV